MIVAPAGAASVLTDAALKQKNYPPSLVITLPALMYGSPQGFWHDCQTVFCGSLANRNRQRRMF